jgi:vancomycin resistance protein YoaR
MNRFKNLFLISCGCLLIGMASYAGFRLAFRGLIFPKVTIAGIKVGGMNRVTALKIINNYFSNNPNSTILRTGEVETDKFNEIKVERDFVWAVEQAMSVGRNGNFLTQVSEQAKTVFSSREVSVPISYDVEELTGYIEDIATETNKKIIWPKLVRKEGKVSVVPGVDGLEIQTKLLENMIANAWSKPGLQIVDVPTKVIVASENFQLINQAVDALNKWGDKRLSIRYGNFVTVLTEEEMIGLFGLTDDVVDRDNFRNLLARIQQRVETEPRDAVFSFEEGSVVEFKPEVVGVTIDIPEFNKQIGNSLLAVEDKALEIPVILSEPKIKAGDINNLGIKELIGKGKSSFSHSIPGRVFNVNLASTRIDSTLIAPGEEFSFNKAVGDISRASGYQSAYIISGGKTILGDGGGVCQVSTTVFRAALDAGLPITERKAHAYRVGYYEQDSKPGIDATVYNPTVDFKFINDTENHILVQTKVDTRRMTMEIDIYGTNDGRIVTLTEPRISSQTPPPATVYVDDPTLATGQMKQIDWSAWGAKVSFDYKVTKGGETIFEKTFYSNYQPWQAVYLRGTN